MTAREPARDVVARSLAVEVLEQQHGLITKYRGPTATHEDMLLYLAEQIDMLYTATDKLLQAVQLLVQAAAEQGQGIVANGTNTVVSGGTPSKSA